HTLVEQLVGMAISGMACNGTQALLTSDHLSIELAQRIKKDLDGLQRVSDVVECMNVGERLMALDSVMVVRRDGLNGLESLSGGPSHTKPDGRMSHAIDWNITLRRVNYWYDRLVVAARIRAPSARKKALQMLEADLQIESRHPKKP